jgi:hypothetical protein
MDKRNTINNVNVSKGFWRDIMTDNNSNIFSMTKLGSLIGMIMMFVVIMSSTVIMIKKGVIDHVLIVEIIGFTLTAVGYKNGFGFNMSNKIGSMDVETINSVNALNDKVKDPSLNTPETIATVKDSDDMPPENAQIEENPQISQG